MRTTIGIGNENVRFQFDLLVLKFKQLEGYARQLNKLSI